MRGRWSTLAALACAVLLVRSDLARAQECGNGLFTVWGTSASDVFVAGTGDKIFHFDGLTWSPMTSVGWGTNWSAEIYAIWGTSSTDVFAVGQSNRILHFDGAAWSLQPPGTTDSGGTLKGVWGSSPNDVFAVGGFGYDRPSILHYDGDGWTPMAVGASTFLSGVWGTSATDVFAVGSYGTILHYDGESWSPMTSGTTADLLDVWGTSPTDVFAVGESGTVLHYDGEAWSAIPAGTPHLLTGIWGRSSSDLYAIGFEYRIEVVPGGAIWHPDSIFLHFDGVAWSPADAGNARFFGTAVWGTASGDLFVPGSDNLVWRHDGTAWGATIPCAPILSVWGSSPSDVFAATARSWMFHYDGVSWLPMDSYLGNLGWGFWGSSPGDVFSVGWAGSIGHLDGSSWEPMPSGTTLKLNGVWGSAPDDVFAVGDLGTIVHYDGEAWSPMASSGSAILWDVWGSSSRDVYAVGDEYPDGSAVMLYYDGSTWSPTTLEGTPWLSGIWGTSFDNVFAVGAAGTILHGDGSTWSPMTSGTGENLFDVSGGSPRNVLAVGAAGTILHYDGSSWSPVPLGTTHDLIAVWAHPSGDAFVVGQYGTLLHLRQTFPPTGVSLSGAGLAENRPPGTVAGLLETADENAGDTFVYGLVDGPGNDDNASFTIAGAELRAAEPLDFEERSSRTIRVRSTDGSGLFVEEVLTVRILDVNEAPGFAAGADVTVTGDAGPRKVPSWATAISAGPGEEWQVVDFVVTNDHPALFSAQPAIAADGTLSFTPAAFADGSATVTVRIHDNGGTANGGCDTSESQAFTIRVLVNRAPEFAPVEDRTVTEGSQLTFAVSATDPEGGPVVLSAPGLPDGAVFDAASRVFSWRPRLDQSGSHAVVFRATDAGTPPASRELTVVITVTDPGGPVFFDDFADGASAGDWIEVVGKWSATGAAYVARSLEEANLTRVATLDPAGFPVTAGVLQARVKLVRSGAGAVPNAVLLFDFQDAGHFRWVRITETELSIGQTGNYRGVGGGLKKRVTNRHSLGSFTRYTVRLTREGRVRVFRGSGTKPALSHRFLADGLPSTSRGGVGLGAIRARSVFDDVTVWDDAVLGD